MDIILYLIQYQHQQICWLINFICRYIPLKQRVFDNSHSPKYQNLRLISFLSSKPLSNKTGNSFSNTISGSMVNWSNLLVWQNVTTPFRFTCPHCGHTLVTKKDRKFFRVHKCVNPKCSYYLFNLKKVDQKNLDENYGKNKYKLHYIYREFTVDFFAMDLNSLPRHASSLKICR